MSTELLCENDRQRRFLKILFQNAGVETRQTVVPWQAAYQWKNTELPIGLQSGPTTAQRMKMYREHAGPLAIEAAKQAFNDSGIEPSEITHLVTVSCTGFSAPGLDYELIRSLELRRTTERVHVGFMGCHGAINGLRTADAIAARHPQAKVLVCAVELCSLHYRLAWDTEGVKGNALFSDGAAAVIGGTDLSASRTRCTLRETASCVIPDSYPEMSWDIGDNGFEMRMTSQVPVAIRQHLKSWLTNWLRRLDYSIDDVADWCVHPGGPRILDAVEESLTIPTAACNTSREILRRYGNMSSPTVIFILHEILQRRSQFPIVSLAFGPGLTAEAALWEPGKKV